MSLICLASESSQNLSNLPPELFTDSALTTMSGKLFRRVRTVLEKQNLRRLYLTWTCLILYVLIAAGMVLNFKVTSVSLSFVCKRLKVSTFIYRHLQGNPDQQRFTIQSGVLTGNDTRWRSASSDRPLPEWTDFGPRSLQLWLTPAGRTMAFTPQ